MRWKMRPGPALPVVLLVLFVATVMQWGGRHPAEATQASSTATPMLVRRVVQVAFDDALFDLEESITGKGLKITYRADIASMLERTGKDLGFTEKIFRGGVVLQFCSAKLSYQAMKANPANIAFCPYGIFLYETEREPGKSVVGYRPLPINTGDVASDKARAAINALLESIVKEVAGE